MRASSAVRTVVVAACLVDVLVVGCSASGVGEPAGARSASIGSPVADSSATPQPTAALTATGRAMAAAAGRVLTGYGWEVQSASQAPTPSGATSTEVGLVIHKPLSSTGSPWVAPGTTSWVTLVRYPAGSRPVSTYFSRCTPSSCTIHRWAPSCFYGEDCPTGAGAVPTSSSTGLAVGSVITWESLSRSGRGAESVVGAAPGGSGKPTSVLPDQAAFDLMVAVLPPTAS
jgi:hypothetical protein